jgi:hypothetical protein
MDRRCDSRHRFWRDRYAVEGFFSEIPALVVVIIALTAFMINAIGAYSLHTEAMDVEGKIDRADSIAGAFSSFDPILHNGKTKRFWAPALDDLEEEDIEEHLNMPRTYRIIITEYTGIKDGCRVPGVSWLFGEQLGREAPDVSVSTTVLVGHGYENDPVFHVAEMVVMLW